MTNTRTISALIVGAAMAWTVVADDATTIFFRPEGPGDPMQPGEVYTWDTTLQNWFDETTGGTAQAWVDGHIANVRWDNNANGAVIEVANGADCAVRILV